MNKTEKFDRRNTGEYVRGPEFMLRLNSRAHALEGQGELLLWLLRAIIFPSETTGNQCSRLLCRAALQNSFGFDFSSVFHSYYRTELRGSEGRLLLPARLGSPEER